MADHNLTCPYCEGPLTLLTVTVERPRAIPNLVNTTADNLWRTDYVRKQAKAVLCDRCDYAEEVSDLHARAALQETRHAEATGH